MSYIEAWSRMYDEAYKARKEQLMTPTEQVSIVMDKYVEACSKIKELETENAGLRNKEQFLKMQMAELATTENVLQIAVTKFIKEVYNCRPTVADAIKKWDEYNDD